MSENILMTLNACARSVHQNIVAGYIRRVLEEGCDRIRSRLKFGGLSGGWMIASYGSKA